MVKTFTIEGPDIVLKKKTCHHVWLDPFSCWSFLPYTTHEQMIGKGGEDDKDADPDGAGVSMADACTASSIIDDLKIYFSWLEKELEAGKSIVVQNAQGRDTTRVPTAKGDAYMESETIWPRSWLFVSVVSDEPKSPDPYAGNSHWSLETEQSDKTYEKNDSTEERKTNKGGEVSVTVFVQEKDDWIKINLPVPDASSSSGVGMMAGFHNVMILKRCVASTLKLDCSKEKVAEYRIYRTTPDGLATGSAMKANILIKPSGMYVCALKPDSEVELDDGSKILGNEIIMIEDSDPEDFMGRN